WLSKRRGTLCLQSLDLGELGLERPDLLLVVVGEIGKLDVFEQNAQHIAEPPELAAVAADLFENLFFELRVSALAEVDVDEPELASDRVEHPIPRIDRLSDVA